MRFSPPLRHNQWPLRVGNSWLQEVVIEYSTGRRIAGRLKADVVSYEPITVPAGTFMTFKLVLSLSGTRFAEVWYAPEARTSARSIAYDSRGTQQVVTELLDFQRSNDPIGSSTSEVISPPTPARSGKDSRGQCPYSENWSSAKGRCAKIGE
jgi:hypothetical protein